MTIREQYDAEFTERLVRRNMELREELSKLREELSKLEAHMDRVLVDLDRKEKGAKA